MDAHDARPELRAVLVGAGVMGRFHAAAIARAGGQLAAVVELQPERGAGLAREAEVVTSLEELSGRERTIDVVHVCTPVATHAELVAKALALGAHVLVEKPLAPSGPETASLIAAADERGLMVIPVHQFLFQPGVKRLLGGGARLGSLVRCVFETATAGADKTGLDADELVQEILPHPLSLFSRLAPVELAELAWTVVRPAKGELRAIAHAAETTFEIAISARARPTRASLELVGTEASARADLFHGFAVVERGAATRGRKAARPFTLAASTVARAGSNLAARALQGETAYPGLRELVRLTYDSVRRGSPPPIDARETLDVALARDAILASYR